MPFTSLAQDDAQSVDMWQQQQNDSPLWPARCVKCVTVTENAYLGVKYYLRYCLPELPSCCVLFRSDAKLSVNGHTVRNESGARPLCRPSQHDTSGVVQRGIRRRHVVRFLLFPFSIFYMYEQVINWFVMCRVVLYRIKFVCGTWSSSIGRSVKFHTKYSLKTREYVTFQLVLFII